MPPRRTARSLGLALGLAVTTVGCGADEARPDVPDATQVPDARPLPVIDGHCDGDAGRPRVLVFTRENMWIHDSNPVARAALLAMCESRGFTVTASADPNVFTADQLARTDVVVFSQTSGPVLDDVARSFLEPWLRAGGGYVGFHAAGATEWEWPFFLDFIGARFHTHADGLWDATVTVEPVDHPITQGMAAWTRTDEWYVFFTPPEDVPGMTMLLALDEDSLPAAYPADVRVGYHPIAWVHERFGGRYFYTGMGHTAESFAEPQFVELVARAIEWTADLADR